MRCSTSWRDDERDDAEAADHERHPGGHEGTRRRPHRSSSGRRRGRRTRRPTARPTARRSGTGWARRHRPSAAARSTSVTSAIGSTTRNIARQPRNDSTTPDTVGPTAGATEMTIERLPMTAPRRAGGTSVITVVISSGSMIAVPLACTTRAASSTGKPGASAATSVPALNRPIAVPYSARVATRRIRKPVIGMITDIVSRKPAVSHWPTFGETLQVGHQDRQRHRHDRLVEDHDERGDQQHADDRAVTRTQRRRGGAHLSRVAASMLSVTDRPLRLGRKPSV